MNERMERLASYFERLEKRMEEDQRESKSEFAKGLAAGEGIAYGLAAKWIREEIEKETGGLA